MAASPRSQYGWSPEAVRLIVAWYGGDVVMADISGHVRKQTTIALTGCLVVVGSFLFMRCLITPAQADPVPCTDRVSSYVSELDQLLLAEKNWIRPFKDLNKKHFPLRDCEVNALLNEVQRSSFLQSKYYDAHTNRYFIVFSNGDVETGFNYVVSGRKSEFDYATFTRK